MIFVYILLVCLYLILGLGVCVVSDAPPKSRKVIIVIWPIISLAAVIGFVY